MTATLDTRATTTVNWRDLEAAQQPSWPNQAALNAAVATLKTRLPLVSGLECDSLTERLASVARGKAFVLQAGDCAEAFDRQAATIRTQIRLFLQMNLILMHAASVPIVKIGRIAGQYAKPRSGDTETQGDVTLPSYRGLIINGPKFTAKSRTPDPRRMIEAYDNSVATLNLIRTSMVGGFADLRQVHAWNATFVRDSPQGERYEAMAAEIDRALAFMTACGMDLERNPVVREADFFVSHEGLLLDYEAAFLRHDMDTDRDYDLSAHMLWIGERTRSIDGAHVAFFSQISNPIGVKIGPTTTPSELLALCEALNPDEIPGRLTLISRMGAEHIRTVLPPLLRAVQQSEIPVAWICDPMHGNTETSNGYKTRRFEAIIAEIEGFFAACRAENVWPGGVHLELTGDNVTECLGGGDPVEEHHLSTNYTTLCDPRLNGQQALDLAFRVAVLLAAG